MTDSIASIKERIIEYKGKLVRCKTAKGRNRFEETEGVIMDTYPKLFTLYDNAKLSTVSFSYAEVLTGEVALTLVEEGMPPLGRHTTEEILGGDDDDDDMMPPDYVLL